MCLGAVSQVCSTSCARGSPCLQERGVLLPWERGRLAAALFSCWHWIALGFSSSLGRQ